jgi:hypothetical protein
MNEYFEEYAREQNLAPVSRSELDDPRYYKNADALYRPLSAYTVLLALCTYPGINSPMFDNAVISGDTESVAVELDDMIATTYVFTGETT